MANENPPKLRTHDRYGHRIDEVEFHPYWHDLMRTAVENGLAGAPWADADAGRHAHVRRAVGYVGLDPGRDGPRLPDDDDLRRRPGAAPRRRSSRRATSRG